MHTVVFDLDGTLTDPKIGITRCIQYALQRLDQPIPPTDELTWCIGPPLFASLRTLIGEELAPRALTLYRERFVDIGLYENVMYAGVTDTLAALVDGGTALYVASSKPLPYVQRILDHFDLRRFFAGVYGSELDGTRTDKTELLAFVLKQSGLDPARTTMVGDRAHDVVGALNNHIGIIGVLYGYGDAEELGLAGAQRLARRPMEIIPLLA